MLKGLKEMEQEPNTELWYAPSILHLPNNRLTPCVVWFRYYRKENFSDDSLPPGKWTKRESKQNWVRPFVSHMSGSLFMPTLLPAYYSSPDHC